MDGEDSRDGIVSKTEFSIRDRTIRTSLKDGRKPFIDFLLKFLKSEMVISRFDN